MRPSLKIAAGLLANFAMFSNQVLAFLPPIDFENYGNEGTPVDLSSPHAWEPIHGDSEVSAPGTGFGGTGKALRIAAGSLEEAWLRKPVAWDPAEQTAFIDFRIKPAATPAGSQANFFANGTQLAFQLPAGSTAGELWVLHGNDDAAGEPPPEEKWYLTAGSFTVPSGQPASTDWVRATLRHDYQRDIWDLFIDGKLAAVNLGFEGRGDHLTHLEFFGSTAGDTLIDNLEASPSNMLFPDADKDGLPDAWETANGSNPNLYDRDAIKQGTGKSFLDHYLDSLWNALNPGTPVNGAGGLGKVGTVPPLTILESHQPVGALKGQFAVGGDGAATYTIPIDLPKGRAGMEPKLSLNYSSNGGNGPMGVGWSLGGLQKITRGPSSLKKDGLADGADFDANDRFYLDGERLVCISGTYGASGSEYRTEMDSFARIKAWGQTGSGPSYWTVETKSGVMLTLGGTMDSRVEIHPGGPQGPVGVLSWLVNVVADTTGKNAYRVQYRGDASDPASSSAPSRYPSKVYYTVDPSQPAQAGFSSVDLEYEGRPDTGSGYVEGVKQEANLRLKRIEVNTGAFLNHAYELTYFTSQQTGRSLLQAVDKVASDGSRVPATTFQWETLFHGDEKWEQVGHLDFNEYGSGDDSGGGMASFVSVSESDPGEIHLTGNAWRTYPLSPAYAATSSTRLRFDYKTTAVEPKWGMIGLDEDTSTGSPKRLFKLVGGLYPPVGTYNDNAWKYTSAGNWQTIDIPLGQNYTGTMNFLALVNDDNSVNDGVGESWFRNIVIYQSGTGVGSGRAVTFDQALASPSMMDGSNEDLGVRVQDLNGDGLPDIAYNLLYGKSSGNGPVTLETFGQALRNTGSDFVNDPALKLPPVLPTANLPGGGEGQFVSSQAICAVPVDINGDGRLDYAYPKNLNRDSSSTFSCQHGYMTWDPATESWIDLPEYTHHFKSTSSQKRFSHFEHLDLDSDGDLDVVVHPYGATLSLLPGKPDTTPATFPLVGNSGSNGGIAYLNKHDEGLGWVASREWSLPVQLRIPGFNTNGGEVGRGLQDLDGDGRPDVYAALWLAGKDVWLNTGNGWAAQDAPSAFAVPENITNSNGVDVGTRLVDLNGDGRVDALKALDSGSADPNKGVHLNTGSGWISFEATTQEPDVPWLPEENFNSIDKRGEVSERGTSFVDLNADGLVDFVVSKPTRETVFLNTGSGWRAEDTASLPEGYKEWKLPRPIYPNSTASSYGIRHAMLVDLNGDGVSDLIGDMKEPVPTVWINRAKPERIVSFTDGFAAQIQVNEYRRLNDPEPVANGMGRRVYDKTPVSALLPGHVSIQDNRWVVARYSEPDGMGGRRYRSQYYGDLRHDKLNEASLGFGVVEVHDEVTQGYTVTTTRRDYPFAGSPDVVESYAYVSGPMGHQPGIAVGHHRVSRETSSYDELPSTTGTGGVIRRPVQTGSVAEKWDLDGTLMSEVATTQNLADFDTFGFVKKSTVTALDGSTVVTESGYWHGTAGKWLLGRLRGTRVTKTANGSSIVKSTGFAYRASDGLLVKEVVEPTTLPAFISEVDAGSYDPEPKAPTSGSPGHPGGVKKTYVLDDFGNVTSEAVTSFIDRSGTQQTRTKLTEWGHDGRFPISEDNGIGEVTYTYDAASALVTQSTDLDGRVTTFEYDSFGTQIASHLPDGTSTAEITRFVANGHLPAAVIAPTAGATLRWARRAQSSGTPWATVYFDTLGREIVTEKLVLTSLENGTPRFANQYAVTCYDAKGRKLRTSNPFLAGEAIHWTVFHYDVLDRVYMTTRPDGETEGLDVATQSVANPGTGDAKTLAGVGNMTVDGQPHSYARTRDAKGYKLERWTDQQGRLAWSRDASGQITKFNHDPEGRVVAVDIKTGSSTVTQLENFFDTVGNKWKVTDLSGGTSTTVHNGFGEAISATTPHGTISSTYDAFGRVSSVVKPEGTYYTIYKASSPALGAVDTVTGPSGYEEKFIYGGNTAAPYEYGKPITVRKRQSSSEPLYSSHTAYNAIGLVMDEIFAGQVQLGGGGAETNLSSDDDAHVRHEYDPVFGTYKLRTKLMDGGVQRALLSEVVSVATSGNQIATTEKLAHGIQRTVTTDARNGRILGIHSTQGNATLQDLAYAWDPNGNLLSRTDAKANKTETFEYDTDEKGLNRLASSTIGQTTVGYDYDDKGNLISQGGSPARSYSGYRVTSAVIKGQSRSFSYDGAGHMLSDGKRTYTWASFGQLKTVTQTSCPALDAFTATGTYVPDAIPGLAPWEIYQESAAHAEFHFDAAGSRSKQVLTRTHALGSVKQCVTRYLGSYESEDHLSGNGSGLALDRVLHRHSLGNALLTADVPYTGGVPGSPVVRLAVVLTDHVGSTDVIVRADWTGSAWNLAANQQRAERQSFDAWGGRRDQTAWTDLHPAHDSRRQTSAFDHDRGFTGHEMLDDFGLVHMNGRIYDADLGRFLSPDPYVQVPEYSQNFNRYSYVLNNPLSMTDPSGHLIAGLKAWAHYEGYQATKRYLQSQPEVAQVVMIVVAVVLWWTGAAIWSAGAWQTGAFVGGTTGAMRADIAGGSAGDILRGAVVGAVSGAITSSVLGPLDHQTGWAGKLIEEGVISSTEATIYNIAGHALLGGASNAALGGRFQDGFLSGLAGAAIAKTGIYGQVKGDSFGAVAGRTAIAAVVGGTASAIGGGKFANGAWTAAFQHLLNAEVGGNQGVRALAGGISKAVKRVATLLIGEDYGAAWRGLFSGWDRAPTSPLPLPRNIREALNGINKYVWSGILGNPGANGMHGWHAASMAWGAKAFGLLGAPLFALGGVIHETPLDPSFFTENFGYGIPGNYGQGTVNHVFDSSMDILSNFLGLGIGLINPTDAGVRYAAEIGNVIPGPGDPDKKFGGDGIGYRGNPSAAWGQNPF